MSKTSLSMEEVLELQLHSIPLRNQNMKVEMRDQATVVSVERQRDGWRKPVAAVLGLGSDRRVELDRSGVEFLTACTGTATVLDLIRDYQSRWGLSFFEARGVVLTHLKQMVDRGILAIAVPRREAVELLLEVES